MSRVYTPDGPCATVVLLRLLRLLYEVECVAQGLSLCALTAFDAASAERIMDRILQPAETLHGPYLIDPEVTQVLRRYCASGELEPRRGWEAFQDLADLRLTRYPHDPFLARIWELRHNLTA